jgi:hypothetical protein
MSSKNFLGGGRSSPVCFLIKTNPIKMFQKLIKKQTQKEHSR